MSTNNRKRSRWLALLGYLGLIAAMLACSVVGSGGGQLSNDGLLRMDDGVIEVQDENGDWIPVAGQATFELVGALESTDPWTVAGTVLQTNELTQIDEGLEVGDLVRVRGVLLEDETWVAYSIELAEEEVDPIIVLIGVVDSIDPWVVNGIELTVTEETEIQAGIEEGMLVRVEILLLPDGTWEVLSIVLLGDFAETEGCVTVIATVVSVDGDEVLFEGWPTTVTIVIGSDANDNTNTDDGAGNDNDNDNDSGGEGSETTVELSAGQVVLATLCLEDGEFVIIQIIILDGDEDDNGGSSNDGGKVLVCHKPNSKKGGHTLSIAQPAVSAHLGHGDTLGPCP